MAKAGAEEHQGPPQLSHQWAELRKWRGGQLLDSGQPVRSLQSEERLWALLLEEFYSSQAFKVESLSTSCLGAVTPAVIKGWRIRYLDRLETVMPGVAES